MRGERQASDGDGEHLCEIDNVGGSAERRRGFETAAAANHANNPDTFDTKVVPLA